MRRPSILVFLLSVLVAPPALAQTVDMEWVAVRNPGNLGDPDASGFGAVGYAYLIGRYEVTNAQYAPFLNAKATIGDPQGLYQPAAATSNRGGIARAGIGTAGDPYVYT